MQLTKEVKEVVHSLKDYGVYQHEYMFPFMDSFLFYRHCKNLDDYYTSVPEYQDNYTKFHAFFDEVQKEYNYPKLYDIIYAKQTVKGIHCPAKDTTVIWAIKGDIKLIVGDKLTRLLHTLAIHDYDLFNWNHRNLKLNVIKEGTYFPIGNRFAHCLHMEEGQEVLYARYC